MIFVARDGIWRRGVEARRYYARMAKAISAMAESLHDGSQKRSFSDDAKLPFDCFSGVSEIFVKKRY